VLPGQARPVSQPAQAFLDFARKEAGTSAESSFWYHERRDF
jgi:hypothetical protein